MKLPTDRSLFTLILTLALLSQHTMAKVQLYSNVNDLNQLVTQIERDHPSPKKTLVIFDIDDTLLESENFVGSVKWYNWQRGREAYSTDLQIINIKEQQKYHCIFSILGTLFEMGSTQPTQANAANIVEQLKQHDLLYLTARTTVYRGPTERELANNQLLIADKHLLADDAILHFSLDDGHRSAKITYEKAIAMSSGLNKGMVLKSLLKRFDKSYDNIYFIDDSDKNIQQMSQEWTNEQTHMSLFHYTRVSKTISAKEITTSDKAKIQFEHFIATAFPKRIKSLKDEDCN